MKRTLPLLAALAATLAAPVAAQDINSILNPGNFAARMGPSGSAALANLPSDMSALFQMPNGAARVAPAATAARIAALSPEVQVEISRLAPATSIAPVRRGEIARILSPVEEAAPTVVTTERAGGDLLTAMADAAEAAPEGANTLVVNGTNTAVIASGPMAEAPRLSLWQRLFGS